MKSLKILILLLLSLAFKGEAQYYRNPGLLFAKSATQNELTFGGVTTFSIAESFMQAGNNQLVGPVMRYENGKTHLVYQDATTGRKFILTYDALYGLSRPVGFGLIPGGTVDTHHRPAIFAEGSRLYVPVEKQHNIDPVSIYKTRNDNDELIFELSGTTIGTAPTYPMPTKRNSIYVNFGQISDVNAGYNKNTGASFDANSWASGGLISTRLADEDEHYMAFINNHYVVSDKAVIVISGRNDDETPAKHFRRYLLKMTPTAGGQTIYNWSESFNKTSAPSAAEMTANFEYFDTGSESDQAYIPVTSLDESGNIYDVGADGGAYKFIYIPSGSSSVTNKTITLPGTPTLRDGASVSGNNQLGACAAIMPINSSLVYAFFRVTDTGFARIKMYKTVDLGDNWTEEETLFTGIDADIESVIIPSNYLEIEDNKTFVVIGTGAPTSDRAVMYVQKVAFGSLSTTADAYASTTAYTESEYDALMARSYYVEAGKITNTGTTLNTIVDQGTQAQNITTVGSPVLDNGTTPTYVTLDGVNDRLPIPIAGLDNESEGTIFAVVRIPTGATSVNILTASNSGSAADFWGVGKSTTDVTRYTRASPIDLDIRGKETITNAFHIFAFTFQNGSGASVLHWYDGKLQLRDGVVETQLALEGNMFSYPATLTHISVGALIRTTSAFYNEDFKHLAISTEPLSNEQMRKAFKYLATKYGITITDHYQ
jgi:hypothetical protein